MSPFGIALTILPQPLVDIVVGRWTIWFNITSIQTAIWFLYITIMHVGLYSLVQKITGVKHPYLWVALILYTVNLVLVVLGLTTPSYKLLVFIYSIRLGGALIGALITVGIEYVAYKVIKRINTSYSKAAM